MSIRFEHMTQEEWLKEKKARDTAHAQSVTDMYNCTHGPKKDCHACLVGELVAALEVLVEEFATSTTGRCMNCGFMVCDKECEFHPARAVLRKAKALYVGPEEVPLDHGHE